MPLMEGIPISPGYAVGVTINYGIEVERRIEVPRRSITEGEVDGECVRLDDALARANLHLEELEHSISTEPHQIESAALLTAHSMLATEVAGLVRKHIGMEFVNVEQALHSVISAFVEQFKGLPSEYLREREQDVRDVGRRMMRQLAGTALPIHQALPENSIVVACELLPSETIELARAGVVAIVTERGGTHSHTAIVARSCGIPAVTGLRDVTSLIPAGTRLLVDGESGQVLTEPTDVEERLFTVRALKYQRAQDAAAADSRQPCVTRDGVQFSLLGNIGHSDDVNGVLQHDLEGVGLFRTELLFLDSEQRPTFEQQFETYSRIASTLEGRPFVVRTFDLGGDKVPPFLLNESLSAHTSLHLRGLRFSLAEQQLLETQVRAITEVAQEVDVRILFPMVIGIDDFSRAIAVVDRVIADSQLIRRPQVGAMIETPAALFALDEILEIADFVTIGTNDLTQYLLAADRDLTVEPDDCSVLHPAVLRAIDQIVVAARQRDCAVCVCGEDAGNEDFACLLMGLGVTELSMSPARAPSVRHALRHIDSAEAQQLAEQALCCQAPQQVRSAIHEFRKRQVPVVFRSAD